MSTTRRHGHGQGTLRQRTRGRSPWTAIFFDEHGRRVSRSTGTTSKKDAEAILSKLVADVALRKAGVIDSQQADMAEQAKRTIESHLKDFIAKLRAAGRTEKHIKTVEGRIRDTVEACGWTLARDINADRLNAHVNDMRAADKSAVTIGHHLTWIKGFTKWLHDHGKLPRDPLATVKKPNPRAGRRRERRMLLPEEWPLLDKATRSAGERYGLTGQERAVLYRLAIETGLRANELRSLTVARLILDTDHAHVRIPAEDTKSGKGANQYIQQQLAHELAELVKGRRSTAPLFELPEPYVMADMLREDLAAARTAWVEQARHRPKLHKERQESDFLCAKNHEGKALDFHALRHTCGAWLSMGGVHPKAVQSIMRHSTIVLTLDTYGHLMPGSEPDAVQKLPTDVARSAKKKSSKKKVGRKKVVRKRL
ncbi:MAG: tyrosine-type recombinase/integrase [Phycisphaeraceae bacterium]